MDGSLINTSIGPFIVKKILDFFDEPLLFSCIDPAGRIYLAIIVDEIDSINRWFFLPISEARLQKIESGIIPLRDLFISPELSWLFDITGRLFCQETADVKFLKISSVPESYYPDEDSYISLNYDSNIEEPFLLEDYRKRADLQFIAENTGLETVEVALLTPDRLAKGTIGMNTLGSFLHYTQSLFYSLVRSTKGRIPEYIKTNASLNVLPGFSEGSFVLRLQQDNINDILVDNFLGEACLPIFMKMLEAADNKDSLISIIEGIDLISVAHYNKLLKSLSSSDCGISINWASPKRKVHHASLSLTQIRSVITLLNQEDRMTTRKFTVCGELVMAHSKRHRFELYSFNDIVYRGNVSTSLYKYRFEISSFVEATIEETVKLNTLNEKVTYLLLDVRSMNDKEIQDVLS